VGVGDRRDSDGIDAETGLFEALEVADGEAREFAVGEVDEIRSSVCAATVSLDRGGVFGELHRPASSGEADIVDDAGKLPAAGGVEDGGGLDSLGHLVVADPSLDVDGAV